MDSIAKIEVILDNNVPEFMDGIYRISSVISYDSNDSQIKDYQSLIDNKEFYTHKEVIAYVSNILGVNGNIIEIC